MKAVIPTLIILLFLNSCKETDDRPDNYNYYPLAIGNQWKYYSEYYSNANGQKDTARIVSTWTVTDDTIINAEKAYIVSQVDSNFDGSVCQEKTYYSNRADGLYALGYLNNCSVSFWFRNEEVFPNSTLLHPFNSNNKISDSVIIVDHPLYLLKYPIVIGENWTTFEFAPGVGEFRKWISTEDVETIPGNLECTKLSILRDSTNYFQPIFQYISAKGFVKEEYDDTIISMEHITIHTMTILQDVNF